MLQIGAWIFLLGSLIEARSVGLIFGPFVGPTILDTRDSCGDF